MFSLAKRIQSFSDQPYGVSRTLAWPAVTKRYTVTLLLLCIPLNAVIILWVVRMQS